MVVGVVLLLPILVFLIVLSNWHRDIALHLLDLFDDLELCGSVEHVSAPSQQKLQMLGHVSPSNVDSLNGVVD